MIQLPKGAQIEQAEPYPRYRLARQTLRAAIREQLERSVHLPLPVLESATDEMLLRITAPSLQNVLLIVASASGGEAHAD